MQTFLAISLMLASSSALGESVDGLGWMSQFKRVFESDASLQETIDALGAPLRREEIVTSGGAYAYPAQRPICSEFPKGVHVIVLIYRHPGEGRMETRFYFEGGQLRCKSWYPVDENGLPTEGP